MQQSEFANKMQSDAERLGLGPTGEFPEGKLSKNDEGALTLGVGIYQGKVIINFGSPVASLAMTPDQTRALANAMLERANLIKSQRKDTHKRHKSKRS